ncbi:transcriptional regulator [Cellulomonas soli]|uniref:Transcriptional regulator n=1 Tax=Cellulomonas soli TaxID=931535 RepID=A0A512PDF3_9CELL|nr:transcriptional regulator [Cellulomonas soli]
MRDFLVSRRAKVTPEQAGLLPGGRRRVPGLRRGEVAQLAGVSVEYYTQLERGAVGGASDSVLDALARALLLDDAERAHLFDLARSGGAGAGSHRRPSVQAVRPGIQQLLDGQLAPAWAGNRRGDLVATNLLGRALNSPLFDEPDRPVNAARFRFLSPRAAAFYRDWEQTGRDTVAALRLAAGSTPFDRGLSDLVGELSTRSEEFRTLWASHDVRLHSTGTKRLHHPVVGDLDLAYEGLALASDPGLMIFVYSAEPGSASAHALDLLASWAATSAAQERSADGAPARSLPGRP